MSTASDSRLLDVNRAGRDDFAASMACDACGFFDLVPNPARIPFVRVMPVPKLQDQGLALTLDWADLVMPPTNQDNLSMLLLT